MITAELGFTQMPATDQGLPRTPWSGSRGLKEAERSLSRACFSSGGDDSGRGIVSAHGPLGRALHVTEQVPGHDLL